MKIFCSEYPVATSRLCQNHLQKIPLHLSTESFQAGLGGIKINRCDQGASSN